MNLKIRMPISAKKVLKKLRDNGFEAYAVGGCVRDSVLGRIPEDWDITTNASPEQVRHIFPRTIDTGMKHGTVTVRMDGESLEVTTYRIDGNYEDHRHPEQVTFTSSLEEDLKRRDFTINAMAYSEEDGLIDLFGGMDDLERKTIRCVGDPQDRFGEDALRILRAVRFCAQLHFSPDPATREAACSMAPTLSRISAERIQTELVKLLLSPHPETLRLAWECGITKVILPEFDEEMVSLQNNAHHKIPVGEHTIKTLMAVRPDKTLRLTMLLHDIGKPVCRTMTPDGIYHYRGHAEPGAEMAERILQRLKFDKATERNVVKLVRSHSLYPELSDEGVRRTVVQIGEELFPLFLEVKRADIGGQHESVQARKFCYMDEVEAIWRKILERGDCLNLKMLAVTGDDLKAIGIPKGKEIGRILHALLDEVLEDPARNQRAYLLDRAQEL